MASEHSADSTYPLRSYDDSHKLSRTQVLLTKIAKLCSEIRDINVKDKSNKYSSKLSKSTKNYLHNHNVAGLGIDDEHDPHARALDDNIPNPQTHLSYNSNRLLGYEESHVSKPLAQTPDLPALICTSLPNPEAPTPSPSELPLADSRGGTPDSMSSFAEKNGVGSDGDQTD